MTLTVRVAPFKMGQDVTEMFEEVLRTTEDPMSNTRSPFKNFMKYRIMKGRGQGTKQGRREFGVGLRVGGQGSGFWYIWFRAEPWLRARVDYGLVLGLGLGFRVGLGLELGFERRSS